MKKIYNIPESMWWWMIIAVALIVYVSGIFVTIMEPDAATYAIISMEMFDRGNLEITARGLDWLDKPHLQFWITAISLKAFGVNNFGYKLPALLFTILGALYTFRFARHFYSSRHGYLSVIILISTLHLVLSNNDIRAEPFLLGLTIFSLYYFSRLLERWSFKYLIIGSIGLAALMMTKGLFTILPVAGAVFFHLLYRRDWKQIFHWQWVLVGILMLLFMTPVLLSYYQQFDLHPEKEFFGQTNVSGVKFFFWDSQWGRFTNSGPITGKGDPFFFIHTLMWAFSPWAFLLYFGLFRIVKGLIRRSYHHETFTLFGSVFMILIFSISKFQLPHYIVPLFPFLAIISADTLYSYYESSKFYTWFRAIHGFTGLILIFSTGLIQYFFKGYWFHWDTTLLGIIIIGLGFISYRSVFRMVALVCPATLALLFSMYFMNRDFYPDLMKYQSESEVAFYIRDQNIQVENFRIYERNAWVTDFYLHSTIPVARNLNELSGNYVFTNENGLNKIKESDLRYSILKNFPDFHVTTLSGSFLNRETRAGTLQNNYLLKIK